MSKPKKGSPTQNKSKSLVAQAIGFLKPKGKGAEAAKEAAHPPKGKPAPAAAKGAKAASSKEKEEREVLPPKPVRVGATREPAKKPKAAAKGGDVYSGKGAKSAGRSKNSDSYVPGKICPNLCADKSCQRLIENSGYCRLFYIKNWSLIQRKRQIMGDGQLTRYIEEIIDKYPEKYLEAVRGDLFTHDAFQKVVITLELEADADAPTDEDDFDEALGGIKPAIDEEGFE